MSDVIRWRRDIHQHPELAEQETRTARLVALQLERLGLEVRARQAVTGVIGVLRGGRPGVTVALRADMDALPVEERSGLPFASTATAVWDGKTVPVSHVCGHDAHTAMLLGAAKVLAGMRARLHGTVVFIFQPAEEGLLASRVGGARRLIDEGALSSPKPDVIFGLHVGPGVPGRFYVTAGAAMASSDRFKVRIEGRQTHAAAPWAGVDAVTTAAHTVIALNDIVSRELDPTIGPTVLSVTVISGGNRTNILPETVTLEGTLRSLSPTNRQKAMASVDRTTAGISASHGATAHVEWTDLYPMTINPPHQVTKALRMLDEASMGAGVETRPGVLASEDFGFYLGAMPGVFVLLGATPDGVAIEDTAPNHSPDFVVNERALASGVGAHVLFALYFLTPP